MSRSWVERIKALAAKRNGSFEQLAVDLGVGFETVVRWKRGNHKPSRLARQRIEELEKEEK